MAINRREKSIQSVGLSKRLECIVELAGRGDTLCDVGCDHAHVPIRLLQEGRFCRAIGMDVIDGPLGKAKGNLELYGLDDKVELRLSDGLDAFQKGEADTLVITGMGGTLMREILMRELGKFSPEMADFIGHAFDARWIDFYPRDGKTGGAFCAPVHFADRSLVMTNFQGSFSDVSTLAHELGHGWHHRCMAGLPYMMIDEPMPLAETASIFNETMLSWQVLKSCAPGDRLYLLENGLMEATQTVVDIYSRFLFEQEVIDTRADHAMSVDELKSAMLRAQEASYGDGLDPEIRHPYMWACKCHYYSSGYNYYNFPYAFGLLFGKGVFAQYLEKGPAFAEDYCRLLRSCGSAPVADVAASAGIDVREPAFWRSSLEVIRKDIDEFVKLSGESLGQ